MIINSNRFYILNTKRVQEAFLPADLAKTLLFEDHMFVWMWNFSFSMFSTNPSRMRFMVSWILSLKTYLKSVDDHDQGCDFLHFVNNGKQQQSCFGLWKITQNMNCIIMRMFMSSRRLINDKNWETIVIFFWFCSFKPSHASFCLSGLFLPPFSPWLIVLSSRNCSRTLNWFFGSICVYFSLIGNEMWKKFQF